MTVDLRWTPRSNASEQRIYRSDAAFDIDGLPAALAVVGGQDNSFTDATAIEGVAYYWRIVTVVFGSPDALVISNQAVTT